MTINEYKDLAMRTNDEMCTARLYNSVYRYVTADIDSVFPDPGELLDGALGLTGESGEVADIIKKYIFHDHELDIEELVKEIGDVCWYIALLCNAIGVPLEDVMSKNIEKLKNRYPDGFSSEASINRKE